MKIRIIAAMLAAACGLAVHAARDKQPIEARTGPHPADSLRGQVPLANAGFEETQGAGANCPPRWGCSMHADPTSFAFRIDAPADAPEGKQVMCIERIRPEPWSIATQSLDARPMRGARARLSLMVRIDAPGPRAGPWMLVRGPHGSLLDFLERPVASTKGWERLEVELPVGADAQGIEVGATMLDGGRACFDDARLEVLP
jgi:hypothetical protein